MGSYKSALIALLLACGVALTAAYAQDTRKVTEPVIPPSCFVLSAKLSVVDGKTLAETDEDKLDTERIRKAIDGCPKGQAVELKADGARDAFLSGPLDLRAGVTLRVDAKTVLFGSRDPRVYEVSPGSCGVVSQRGGGCRALINGSSVADAAVMGDGTIDGRGWAKVIGKDVSWWDLAEQARAGGFAGVRPAAAGVPAGRCCPAAPKAKETANANTMEGRDIRNPQGLLYSPGGSVATLLATRRTCPAHKEKAGRLAAARPPLRYWVQVWSRSPYVHTGGNAYGLTSSPVCR
jgi:hypothetical protein